MNSLKKWLLDPPPYFRGQMGVQQKVGGFRGENREGDLVAKGSDPHPSALSKNT